MFALPISMLHFKSINFYQNSPKIESFLQKNTKILSAGSSAPQNTLPLRLSGSVPVTNEVLVPILKAYIPIPRHYSVKANK